MHIHAEYIGVSQVTRARSSFQPSFPRLRSACTVNCRFQLKNEEWSGQQLSVTPYYSVVLRRYSIQLPKATQYSTYIT